MRRAIALFALLMFGAFSAGCIGVASSPCDSIDALFEEKVWKKAGSTKCISCHIAEGQASSTRLVLTLDESPEGMRQNREAFTRVARVQRGGVPLVLLKPTLQIPHTGGEQVTVDSDEYAGLQEFAKVARMCAASGPCTPSVTPARARLMTRKEYDSSLTALLTRPGTLPGASMEKEDTVNGYNNDASALKVTAALAEQMLKYGETMSAFTLSNIGDCVISGRPISERGDHFIQCMGQRAFRRPLTDEEKADLKLVFNTGSDEPTGPSFDFGARLVLTALVQSPSFIYRTETGAEEVEPGSEVRLTPHEVASQLSYLITGKPPDAELLAAAESGQLADSATIEEQARRLLAASVSKEQMAHFVFQWLHLGDVDTLTKSDPDFSSSLARMMRKETEEFVKAVLTDDDGTFKTLMSAKYTYADADLGAIYGVSGGESGVLRRIDLDPTQRSGLLTQASVMATFAGVDQTSPIQRGKMLRERVLCQTLPRPPKEIVIVPPPPDKAKTTRQRFAQHSTSPACQTCHVLIDPPGFLFEGYDAIGRVRTVENGEPVDASGSLVETRDLDGDYSSFIGVAPRLAESSEARQCFTQNLLQFSAAREVDTDECAFRETDAAFLASGMRIEDIVLTLVKSERFVVRKVE